MTLSDLKVSLSHHGQTLVRISCHDACGRGMGRNGIGYFADVEAKGGRSKGYPISRSTFNQLARQGLPVAIGWGFGEGNAAPNANPRESRDARNRRYLGDFVYEAWKSQTLNTWVDAKEAV